MERTARVIVLALLFQLYPRVDEIDDVGSGKQVIDKNAWNSSSHKPRFYDSYTQNHSGCRGKEAILNSVLTCTVDCKRK
jgi:hypothetical protein